jgi:hypothetical protein
MLLLHSPFLPSPVMFLATSFGISGTETHLMNTVCVICVVCGQTV